MAMFGLAAKLRFGLSLSRRTAIIFVAGLWSMMAANQIGWAQTTASAGEAESLAAWGKIVEVLKHPRCLNCHQDKGPLQGDSRRVHIPPVERGANGLGVGTMRCSNCHNGRNNEMAGVPGAIGWSLAPAEMLWEGKSSAQLCELLKTPARYHGAFPEAINQHMAEEHLVVWGWEPGRGRKPVPIPQTEFVNLVKVWVSGGLACPQP